MALDLDSAEWASLRDALGPAAAVPALLRALANDDSDVLDELYDRIYHQGSIYSASIAAFPHLIRIAEDTATEEGRAEVLALAGFICESNDLASTLQSSAHADAFSAALPAARDLAVQALSQTSEANDGIYFLKAAMSFSGHAALAKVLDGVVNEEFAPSCPSCGVELYVWPATQGLNVAAEDPVSEPRAKKTQVSKGALVSEGAKELGRLLSSAPSLPEVSRQVPYIFGTVTCPACSAKFSLVDTLIDQASAAS